MSGPARLQIVIGSTRPVRAGEPIARWVAERARLLGHFDVEVVDLREVNLPLLDETEMGVTKKYEHEHTRRWAASVESADAFVFVIPEYNNSFNAATKNALDYVYQEWANRPVGVVCYGGGALGTRAAAALRPVFNFLKMPWAGEVAIGLREHRPVDGVFHATEALDTGLDVMLAEVSALESLYRARRRSAD